MEIKTKKQQLYYEEVIRLRREYGYGEQRISKILPIGHATVSRWLSIFASENSTKNDPMKKKKKETEKSREEVPEQDTKALEAEIKKLQTRLKQEIMRADAYDEMINVAEKKFNIDIRKKAGAKQ